MLRRVRSKRLDSLMDIEPFARLGRGRGTVDPE